MIWREKRTLLIVLGVLLAANTIFFFTYRVQYQSRLDALDTRLEQATAELESVRASRQRTEQTLVAYRESDASVMRVFNEHWSTQDERLTDLIIEVKRLAVASNLVPRAYSFDQGESQRVTSEGRSDTTLQRRASLGASEVGISFAVQGSYAQVRRLINLLELSQQFVIIDQIGLSASQAETLSLNLHIKTLFRDEIPPAGGARL